ncbi:MAG: hypothetical protein JSS83_23070 [Cyanobacteria bacterium SZAS LIN-3]|nr:hypothetical protein [Cyanobacteria bacterium SZAS LIN-3]
MRSNVMKAELDAALVRDFPLLYGDRHAPARQTCMCWGFECGDGWEPLIRDLSAKLEAAIAALPADEQPNYRASQVKEKFGTLRFYLTCGTDEMYDLINAAEGLSAQTCEGCGQPGSVRSGGWIVTNCDECAAKRGH